ncbi:MAG: DNA gyrase C-terminal beta-propeller domain-containing protein, partial [Acetobacteraceae bacterium]
LQAAEEFLLTVTDEGFGKRSSAYEYRLTGRGGQGIANIMLSARSGRAVVATFAVRSGDDVMLVTDAGRLIRVPADQVRITGRHAMGVRLFRLENGERVTSVFPVVENGVEEAGVDERGVAETGVAETGGEEVGDG